MFDQAVLDRGGSAVSSVRRLSAAFLVRRCGSSLLRAALLSVLASCSKDETPASRPAPTSTVPAPRVGTLSSSLVPDAAFAVAPSPFGASVAWMESRDDGGSQLQVVDLNRRGLGERAAWTLHEFDGGAGQVMDLSYAFVGLNRFSTWTERFDTKPRDANIEARVQALRKPEAGDATLFDLGSGYPAKAGARGNVALSTGDGSVVVFVRGGDEPCLEATDEPCYGFRFHRLEALEVATTGITLSVPVPCGDHAALLVMTAPRWHYAVCTELEAQPVMTVFSIQPNPEYASAEQWLRGCHPLGSIVAEERGAIVAQCGDVRKLLQLYARELSPRVEELVTEAPHCAGGVPALDAGSWRVDPSSLRGNIELLLPPEIAPRGSRAVWTGRALVVVWAEEGELRLMRYECVGSELVSVAPLG